MPRLMRRCEFEGPNAPSSGRYEGTRPFFAPSFLVMAHEFGFLDMTAASNECFDEHLANIRSSALTTRPLSSRRHANALRPPERGLRSSGADAPNHMDAAITPESRNRDDGSLPQRIREKGLGPKDQDVRCKAWGEAWQVRFGARSPRAFASRRGCRLRLSRSYMFTDDMRERLRRVSHEKCYSDVPTLIVVRCRARKPWETALPRVLAAAPTR